jgi:hypothetical protein
LRGALKGNPGKRRLMNKSTMNIANECRTASIGCNHAMILPHDANPKPGEFSERTGAGFALNEADTIELAG